MKNRILNALALSLIVLVGSFVSTANATVIIIDNDDQLVDVVGSWSSSSYSGFGFEGSDYLYGGNDSGFNHLLGPHFVKYNIGQHVAFFDGSWLVEMNWKEHSNRASNAPVEVFNADGILDFQIVDQRVADGGWYNIGTYELNADSFVLIDPSFWGADGYVIADAFRFTSVPEPSTLAILGLGLMGLSFRRLKKQA